MGGFFRGEIHEDLQWGPPFFQREDVRVMLEISAPKQGSWSWDISYLPGWITKPGRARCDHLAAV